jgi:hypothetical protein
MEGVSIVKSLMECSKVLEQERGRRPGFSGSLVSPRNLGQGYGRIKSPEETRPTTKMVVPKI